MTNDQQQALIQAAVAVRAKAYAKYSNFHVGAAILSTDGQIFTACNVENVSYGLTICAERAAVFAAIAAGQRSFVALAVATAGGAMPCGACRQVLYEFAPDLPILVSDVDDSARIRQVNLRDLLPGAFDEKNLKSEN